MLDTYDFHAIRLLVAKAEAIGIWRTKYRYLWLCSATLTTPLLSVAPVVSVLISTYAFKNGRIYWWDVVEAVKVCLGILFLLWQVSQL